MSHVVSNDAFFTETRRMAKRAHCPKWLRLYLEMRNDYKLCIEPADNFAGGGAEVFSYRLGGVPFGVVKISWTVFKDLQAASRSKSQGALWPMVECILCLL